MPWVSKAVEYGALLTTATSPGRSMWTELGTSGVCSLGQPAAVATIWTDDVLSLSPNAERVLQQKSDDAWIHNNCGL